MTRDSFFNAEMLNAVPCGIVALDENNIVLDLNDFAAKFFHISVGIDFLKVIHADAAARFADAMASPGQDFQIQFVYEAGTSYGEVRTLEADSGFGRILFVKNISEQVALASQLQKSKQPARKFIHDMSNALTTTLGYSELISMMLEENEVIAGDRLTAVQRYQKEVYSGLQRADVLIKDQKQGRKVAAKAAVPFNRKHVMVVDDEPSIAEFLAELMRGRHYKVTAFTDSLKALEFYKNKKEKVDLVIMDQIMPELSGISLATELLSFNIDLPIVLCTGDQELISEQSSGRLRIKHFIRKPIDINELTQMVSAIID